MAINNNNSSILIKVNSEAKVIPKNITILKLLEIFQLKTDRVVIEFNKDIIRKENFNKIHLNENDELEIVTFVGGG